MQIIYISIFKTDILQISTFVEIEFVLYNGMKEIKKHTNSQMNGNNVKC